MSSFKAIVTKKLINEGKTSDSRSCPIALSLKKKYSDIADLRIRSETFWIKFTDGSECDGVLSRRAKKFIDDFDHLKPVKPQNFILTSNF